MREKFLKGKTAMITGGASGMGRAIALLLAESGADVAIGSLLSGKATNAEGEVNFLPGEQMMEETKKEIEAHGVQCLAMNLDVTKDDSVTEFVYKTKVRFGKIDILANCAGITAEQKISNHPDSAWMKVIEVNLNGTYRAIKRVLPGMIEHKWGRIINIASTAASVGAVTSGAYCASKAGVVGLTRCVALEGAAHGVTCNSISPGWTNSNFGRDWMSDIAVKQENRSGDEYIEDSKKANPQGRLIETSEIAELALYLCRDGAQAMTMQDLTLSAGSLW